MTNALYDGFVPISLADGGIRNVDAYIIPIMRDGKLEQVEALCLGNTGSPLVGVDLLKGNLVTMEMTDGGEVTIEPI